jgi:hypothetical protein
LNPQNVFDDSSIDFNQELKGLQEDSMTVNVTKGNSFSKYGKKATWKVNDESSREVEFEEMFTSTATLDKIKIELEFESTQEAVC